MTMIDKIKGLHGQQLALWSYVRRYNEDEAIHSQGLLKKYPFAKYLFSHDPKDLDDILKVMTQKNLLLIENKAYNTFKRLPEEKPSEVETHIFKNQIDTDHSFFRDKILTVIENIHLHDFLELKRLLENRNYHDPFLYYFSEDLRLGREGWWEEACNLAIIYENLEHSNNISEMLKKFAELADFLLPKDKVNYFQESEKSWKEKGFLQVRAIVNYITPWKKEMPIQITFVSYQDISITKRDQIKNRALMSLLYNATLADIIIPIGIHNSREEDILGSTQLPIFTPEDSKNIFINNNPSDLFGKLLRSKMDIEILSPYQVTYSVPEVMFFGRDEHLRLIAAHPETNYAIYGSRKSGKTSVMNHLQRLYKEQQPVAFINAEMVSCEDDFFVSLCNALNIKAARSYADFEDAAKGIEPGTLLFIDEIDRALKTCDPDRILGILRHLSGQYGVRCIFAGTNELYKQYHDIKSPMYNFADPLPLGPLTKLEASGLAKGPMLSLGVVYEKGDSTIKQLVNYCGCFPNLVQLMCHELVKEVKRRGTDRVITHEMLKKVFEGNAFGDSVYQQFHHNFNPDQKLIVYTSLMVKSMSLKSITERVQEYYRLPISRIEALLDELVLLFIFDKSGTTYEWIYEKFPAILKRQIGDINFMIKQTIMEITEVTKGQ